ncbi:MAG: MerR family transcriptional regulator [bacterium]|jgi:DNA-binding transcriptional MerR regulator|nr:MerR family transcriptional regulator [bacterium]
MESEAAGGKLYYSIGEVCELTGLEAHVLRFWESEFPELEPRKSAGGTRRYRAEDVELIRRIQHLVHGEKYSLEGARRQLRRSPEEGRVRLRAEIQAILKLLNKTIGA